MHWYNEPAVWAANDDTITVTAEHDTDFWRKTHYGFIRDNGHFYYQEVVGDFRCEVKVSGGYAALYDQAGLMVRLDADDVAQMRHRVCRGGAVRQRGRDARLLGLVRRRAARQPRGAVAARGAHRSGDRDFVCTGW